MSHVDFSIGCEECGRAVYIDDEICPKCGYDFNLHPRVAPKCPYCEKEYKKAGWRLENHIILKHFKFNKKDIRLRTIMLDIGMIII